MTKRPALPAAWVAALATGAVRALVALSRMDEQELEFYSGSLAWALMQGMPLDPEQLGVITHNRGSVVLGVLLVPLFWLFGPTLGAVKILAVALSMATAALFAHLLERHGGRVAGLVGALLYALVPPSFQMVDVLALGSHGEAILPVFALLAALLFYRPRAPRTFLHLFALGTLAGFGGFFSMQCLVALPAVLLAWAALWREDPTRAWGWRRAGTERAGLARAARDVGIFALVGLPWVLPAAWMVPSGKGSVIVNVPLSERVLPEGIGGAATKLADTLSRQLRLSWIFEDHGGAWAGWLLFGAAVVGVALGVARLRRLEPLAVFLFVYPATVLGAYAATDFQMKLDQNLDGMGSRYLMAVMPCLAGWIALGAQRLAGAGSARGAALLAAAPAVAGVAGLTSLVDPVWAWRQPTVRATEFAVFHGHVEHAGGDDLERRLEWIERIDPDWPAERPVFYRALTLPEAFLATDPAPRETLGAIRAYSASVQPYLLVELGREIAEGNRPEERLSLLADPASTALSPPLSAQELRWIGLGLGAKTSTRVAILLTRVKDSDPEGTATVGKFVRRLLSLPPPAGRAAVEGMALHLGYRLCPYHNVLLHSLRGSAAVPPEVWDLYFEALGRGYRVRFLEDEFRPPGPLRIEAFLPEGALEPFRRGLRAPGR